MRLCLGNRRDIGARRDFPRRLFLIFTLTITQSANRHSYYRVRRCYSTYVFWLSCMPLRAAMFAGGSFRLVRHTKPIVPVLANAFIDTRPDYLAHRHL